MVIKHALWDAAYMSERAETPLQKFLAQALDRLPRARDHYDRKLQESLSTKGKPLYDIQRGKSQNPSLVTLRHIAEVLELPFNLLSLAAEGEDVRLPDVAVQSLPEAGVGELENCEAPDLPAMRYSDDEIVPIPVLDLSFSMGPGTTIDDYIEETPMNMGAAFLRSVSRAPFDCLRLAKGAGDSMTPTLVGGDLVLIDTRQRHLNMQDRVWAISLYGAAAIKRLRAVGPDKVLVISDSPAVDDQEVDAEDIVISGRVVWFGREL